MFFISVGSILGVFHLLLSLALFSEIRLLCIVGVDCVVCVLDCEQLLTVCLDGRLVSPLKSKLSTERLCEYVCDYV